MRKFHVFFVVLFFIFLISCEDAELSQPQKDLDEKEVINKVEENNAHSVEDANDEAISTNEQTEDNGKNEVDIPNETEVVQQPKYKINPNTWSVEPILDQDNRKVILLTIDDAPDKYSLEMAKTLKELDVNAIFFVNGHFLNTPEEQDVLKQIDQMGFVIGNHTMTHANLSELSPEEQTTEIIALNDLVESIIDKRPTFFRAPFGVNTDHSNEILQKEGMTKMNWTYGYDWVKEYQSKEAIQEIMITSPFLKDGANLLMHDRQWTNEALSQIVRGLQEKGFTILDPKLISGEER